MCIYLLGSMSDDDNNFLDGLPLLLFLLLLLLLLLLLYNSDLDDLLTFTIFADPRITLVPDSITGTDPLTGNTLTSFGRDVTPTTITSSFNGFAAQIAAGGGGAAPLPTGFWAGAILLGSLAMCAKFRGSSVLAR